MLIAALGAAGAILVRNGGGRGRTKCEEDRIDGVHRCTEWETQGYAQCTETRDEAYKQCAEYEDQGYDACDRYEDQGYNSCDEWKRNCCTWWPCSWACEIISWVCVLWVWISNLVCVAWVWITNLVCVTWNWIVHVVCVSWIWIFSFVCKAWEWIKFPICFIICFFRRLFTGNEVSERRSECIYGWNSAYLITEERGCVLNVVVRIRLNPDSDVSAADLVIQRGVWEDAIETAWTGRFPIRRVNGSCDCEEYRLMVDVQWVESGEHHTVRIESGSGRANLGRWFIESTGGTAAHEVGHMLGYVDEYPDEECPDREVTGDDSIMQSSQSGTVRPRHYVRFAEWISAVACCDYEAEGT